MKKKDVLQDFMILILTVAAVFADQWTKILAVTHLKDQEPITWIPDVFELHYLENRGAAFGMLQNQRLIFVAIGIVVLAVAFLIYVKLPHTGRFLPLRICIAAITAGAVGNMIDRVRLQYVIDFLYFKWIDFPIFNVADIYVTVATIALILLVLFYYKEDEVEQLFQCFKGRRTKEHV